MRVDSHGVGIHESLESIGAGDAPQTAERILIPLVENLDDARVVIASQLEPQSVVLDPLAPKVLQLVVGCRPGLIFEIYLVALVALEIKAVFEQAESVNQVFGHAVFVQVEDFKRCAQIFSEDGIIEQGTVNAEAINVALKELELLWVQ